MAVFRIEKTRDYTVMSNYHLRDRSLSLKAKGLLSLMLSLPEDWDYTMKGLARICKGGIDSISGGIRELEAHGYDQPPCQNETSDDPGQNEIQHEQRNTAAQGAAPSAFQRKLFQFMPPLLFLFLWNGQQRIHILLDDTVFLGFSSRCLVFRKEPFLFCREIDKLRFHAFRCRQRDSPQPFQFSGGCLKKNDLALMPPQELFFIIRFTVSVIKRL